MQFIPKDRILEFRSDTFVSIRKEYNLDKPGAMANAIRILREWVEKQPHFKKKDFSDFYLETSIISSKGSVERAKEQLDRICTFRTVLPQYFGVYNVKTDFRFMYDGMYLVLLPKLTPDHYRVLLIKFTEQSYRVKDFLNYVIYGLIVGEYIRTHDYCRGFYVIVDFTEVNLMEILSNFNVVQIKQGISTLTEGYGMRIKGIFILTPSKLVDTLITIVKQVCSPKIGGRIHSHSTIDCLPSIVPLDILPKDYGGKERSITTLLEDWIEVLSSKEHMEHLKDMEQAGTDESCRQVDKFHENYAGMPGTFRMLSID